ncbi:MAG: toxic anion resistance protein [Anaerovoracaceae bacterium]
MNEKKDNLNPGGPELSFGEPAAETPAADAQTQFAEAPTAPDVSASMADALQMSRGDAEITDWAASAERALSPEELSMVDDFVDKIDLTDTQAVTTYGAGTQTKMANFSEETLSKFRTKDMGEVGGMITSLVMELKNLDVDDSKGGIGGFFRKKKNNFDRFRTKYRKIEGNIDEIVGELQKRQVQLMKDSALLDKMFELNQTYYKELSMYILAGKRKLDQVRGTELKALQDKAAASGDPQDAQAARDLSECCNRFEKKLHDLQLTRTISLQTAPQIRMIQASDNVMAEKIQSTIVNTIPLWKNQMVIALGIEHSQQAARAQREVTDMTNELLRKNADALKTATVDTARESERGVVDIETLQHTNETLISTLDEILQIQEEGRQKRAAAEAELGQIENQLKEAVLNASRK